MCPVLIVDDSAIFRNVLKTVLASRFPSIEIDEAANGKEALSEFQKTNPFLVFMDIRLPDTNGLEITRAIKEANPGIEVIILTSHGSQEYREAAVLSGASHFLTKGDVKAEEINTLVESVLRTNEGCASNTGNKSKEIQLYKKNLPLSNKWLSSARHGEIQSSSN